MKHEPSPGALLVTGLLVILGMFVADAWLLMLLLGAMHHEVSTSIPAVGFGGAALLTATLALVAGLFKAAR